MWLTLDQSVEPHLVSCASSTLQSVTHMAFAVSRRNISRYNVCFEGSKCAPGRFREAFDAEVSVEAGVSSAFCSELNTSDLAT